MPLLARISSWFLDSPDASPTDAPTDEDVDPDHAYADLRASIEPARRALVEHPIYEAVDSLPRLRAFMGAHVYAVWDFMCLAKRLQRDLTSMEPLWRPPPMPDMARFINGVVLGEESDDGPDREAISHCELYISAMEEVGAPTTSIRRFLGLIADGVDVEVALAAAAAPRAARAFVRRTLDYVMAGDTVEVLSAFLFGREDLIPDMFRRLLPRWRESRGAPRFTYYVERHIELDGDDHGPAARRALIQLAGREADAWRAARRIAEDAIAARVALWDRVHAELD
jgi:Protein of unknown function (DUF3050)